MNRFEIAYEIVIRFMSDLLKAVRLNILDVLIASFERDTFRFDSKIAILMKSLPLFKRSQILRLMKAIENVLNLPTTESLLRNNINPMRTGLMLFRAITEIVDRFKYSKNSSDIMKFTLVD